MEILFLAALLGIIPAIIASRKGHSFILWWFFGALLFIVALPLSLLLKPNQSAVERAKIAEGMKKCPFCAELIKGDARVCRYCGRDVPATAAPASPTHSGTSRLFLAVLMAILAAAAILAVVVLVPKQIREADEAHANLSRQIATTDGYLGALRSPSVPIAKTSDGSDAVVITRSVRVSIPGGEVIIPAGTRSKLLGRDGDALYVEHLGYQVSIPEEAVK